MNKIKINIYNQFINYSENINDYNTLVDNLEKLYDNSIKILSDLIGFRTISGEDNNDLIKQIMFSTDLLMIFG